MEDGHLGEVMTYARKCVEGGLNLNQDLAIILLPQMEDPLVQDLQHIQEHATQIGVI